ncbi:ABC transporter ATP-binding protein [Alphaproteobacteria bacterium]|nr:ABC transporter ATP-binding protein [Alphaproteobacteria bacterium]
MAQKPTSNPIIVIQDVEKHFGTVAALDGVSLDIEAGEFFSLLGPSGCGKTTLLRMISGFDNPTSGAVYIGGTDMTDVPPNERPTNMVFQSYAIFPHLNVAENVGYGLKRQKLPKEEVHRRVEEALALVDLSGYGPRGSHALSGGQRQRVALARALIMQPKVLLLDEPLSALDKKLRDAMQSELCKLQRTVGITFVLVTHDQEEALIMSDRIAVMFDGKIAQLDTPEGLYKRPKSKRVASFIGVMNFIPAKVTSSSAKKLSLEIEALGKIDLPAAPEWAASDNVTIGIRPEMLTVLYHDTDKAERAFKATIEDTAYYGDMTYYEVRLENTDIIATVSMRNTAGRPVLDIGAKTRVSWGAESITILGDD